MKKSTCLQCGKSLEMTAGKREKKFCSPSCRIKHFQKEKKDPKWVQWATYQAVLDENADLKLEIERMKSKEGQNKAILAKYPLAPDECLPVALAAETGLKKPHNDLKFKKTTPKKKESALDSKIQYAKEDKKAYDAPKKTVNVDELGKWASDMENTGLKRLPNESGIDFAIRRSEFLKNR